MSNSPSPAPAEPGRLPHLAATRLTGWRRWVPGLQTIETYQAVWLKHDITAGLVLTTLLVPVGISYAEASGVAGIYGLYATIMIGAGTLAAILLLKLYKHIPGILIAIVCTTL